MLITGSKLRLSTRPGNNTVSMASTSLSSQKSGYCLIKIEVERRKHFDTKLSVFPDLCIDVILGQDFMGQHKSISKKFGKKNTFLSVWEQTTISILPPRLFANIAENCKLIAVKSRKDSNQSKEFIVTEVNRGLSKGIIKTRTFP